MLERSTQKEIMDTVELPPETQRMVMRRLAWFNRVFLNNWLIYQHCRKLARNRSELSILDVGTGIADVPRYLVKKFRARGIRAVATGIDINKRMIDLAAQEIVTAQHVSVAATPLASVVGAHDVLVCSQAIHHLTPLEAQDFFRLACAKAKLGVVISDLVRSRLVRALVRCVMWLTLADRYNKHDGPLSVLRSYSDPELRSILHQAGITNFEIHNYFFRKIIVIRKQVM